MSAVDIALTSRRASVVVKTRRLFWQALRNVTTSSDPRRKHLKLLFLCLVGVLCLGALLYQLSWTQAGDEEPYVPGAPGEVAVLVRTYAAANRSQLRALLYSLQAQTYNNFRVWLLDSNSLDAREFADEIWQMNDDRFSTFKLTQPLALDNSYGYAATEIAVNHVMQGFRDWWAKSPAGGDDGYILITNGDNLYHHRFLSKLVSEFKSKENAGVEDTCLVSTNFVSRYHSRTSTGAYGPRNQVRATRPAANAADLGSVLVSARALDRAFPDQVRFVKHSTQADFAYFNAVWQASGGLCWKTFGEVLFVHQ